MLKYNPLGRAILDRLKAAGYTTTRIRKENLLNEAALQYLRQDKPVGAPILEKLCVLLECQPNDIYISVDPETGNPTGKRQQKRRRAAAAAAADAPEAGPTE